MTFLLSTVVVGVALNLAAMSPAILPLAPSESKSAFMKRLGLNLENTKHRQLYRSMKSDAITGYVEVTSHRTALLPQLRNDASVKAPYTYAQMSETALHRAIMDIYLRADHDTRNYYDVGRNVEGPETENWVIRWLLWHVFRYRDRRNRAAAGTRGTATQSSHCATSGFEDFMLEDTDVVEEPITTVVRCDDKRRALTALQIKSGLPPAPSSSPITRLPYDPARD